MAIGLEAKKAIVASVQETASNALSLVVADARGVSVGDITGLRKLARENNVALRVVRNTLARRAVAGTEFECAAEVFVGPSMLAFSMADPGAGARLFKNFAQDNENFEIKALAVSGQLMDAGRIDVLAALPTLEQALAMLANVTLAPVTRLARTCNELPAQITRVIAAVGDQKDAA